MQFKQMFVTAVCVLFLLKLKWPKSKNFYEIFEYFFKLPSSAKHQREMIKFCGVYEEWTTPANFSYFHLELNGVVAYVVVARFWSHWHTEMIQTIANFACKIKIHFLLGVVLDVVVVVA